MLFPWPKSQALTVFSRVPHSLRNIPFVGLRFYEYWHHHYKVCWRCAQLKTYRLLPALYHGSNTILQRLHIPTVLMARAQTCYPQMWEPVLCHIVLGFFAKGRMRRTFKVLWMSANWRSWLWFHCGRKWNNGRESSHASSFNDAQGGQIQRKFFF